VRNLYPGFDQRPPPQEIDGVEIRPGGCCFRSSVRISIARKDRIRNEPAVTAGLDDARRSVADDVAARIHSRHRGLQGQRVHVQIAGRGQLDLAVAEDPEIRPLADGNDEGVERHLALAAFDLLGPPPPGRIRLAEPHRRHLDRFEAAVRGDDPTRRHELERARRARHPRR